MPPQPPSATKPDFNKNVAGPPQPATPPKPANTPTAPTAKKAGSKGFQDPARQRAEQAKRAKNKGRAKDAGGQPALQGLKILDLETGVAVAIGTGNPFVLAGVLSVPLLKAMAANNVDAPKSNSASDLRRNYDQASSVLDSRNRFSDAPLSRRQQIRQARQRRNRDRIRQANNTSQRIAGQRPQGQTANINGTPAANAEAA